VQVPDSSASAQSLLASLSRIRTERHTEPVARLAERVAQAVERRSFRLPALPERVRGLRELPATADAGVLELAQLAGGDPRVTACVTNIANSSFFAGLEPVHSLRDAIVRMGVHETRNIVVGIALRSSVFRVESFERAVAGIWTHSLATAVSCESILCEISIESETGFLIGLLHDIGRVAVLAEIADLPPNARPDGQIGALSDAVHAQLGALLVEAWQLPREFCDAIRDHHAARASAHGMTAVLRAADQMAHCFGDTREALAFGAGDLEHQLVELGVAPGRMALLLADARAHFDDLAKVL
jgi:putative nucleotidyltransferase with HDIG domain